MALTEIPVKAIQAVLDQLVGPKPKLSKPVVLVVEDEEELREMWGQVLQPHSVEVLHAGSLVAGFRQYMQADILILDWRLSKETTSGPLFDAWIVAEKGPCIIVSGFIAETDAANLYSRGAWHVLSKPIDPDALVSIAIRVVRAVITAKQLAAVEEQVSKMRRTVLILFIGLTLSLGGGPTWNAIWEFIK